MSLASIIKTCKLWMPVSSDQFQINRVVRALPTTPFRLSHLSQPVVPEDVGGRMMEKRWRHVMVADEAK